MKELTELFDHLPMVVFWVKNLEGRFIKCNRGFEEMHGLRPDGWVDKTDFDLHPVEVASGYQAEDERVMEMGVALPDQLWMVPDGKGVLDWWNSTKIPVRDDTGNIIGVAGAMYRVSTTAGVMAPYRRVEGALRLMHERYAESLKAEEIARSASLSVSQFNRVFREVMDQSPKEYVNRLRLNAAKRLLVSTDLPLAEIALEVGFYDGSEFGKRFRESEGITPRAYRLRLREMIKEGGN